jgi:Fuc2NAc and GlcNAc transferase
MITGITISAGGFVLGTAGAWFMSRFAYNLGLVDLPNDRSSHTLPTPRGGGVGILVTLILSATLLRLPLSFWCPAAFLAIISFFDDRLELSPKLRLAFQFAAAIVVVAINGFNGQMTVIDGALMVFWPMFIVGTANFYNFMDGIDGLAGFTGFIGFLLVAFYGFVQGASPAILTLAAGLALACLGFLLFNFPKAKVFMGDVGSILLGFIFAVFVLYMAKSTADFICMIAFMFPFYADALTTLYIRYRDGEKLSQAHRRHLYQVLANEFEHPHWKVSLGYAGAQLVLGLLMIWAHRSGLIWQLFVLGGAYSVFIACSLRYRRIAGTAAAPQSEAHDNSHV